ncbi:fimbria/pilus periplasmic chaperone [Enterobacteriaceae bacterium 4M9]|nr:fimbria/pilus periplasmic chaperone [Enterobacteriaceae bacterium 4M9]
MNSKVVLLAAAFLSCCLPAFASMTISGTRIIFPSKNKEVGVRTTNKGNDPVLVQVWVDDGNTHSNVNQMRVPFIVTPPVYRVEPGKGQSLRLIYNGLALPQDRESVFWFNLLEIPPKTGEIGDDGQKLELAFRTRIKIFYRPDSLKNSNIEQEFSKLSWSISDDPVHGRGIKVTNPTPFHFSFDGGSVVSHNRKIELQTDMVAPMMDRVFFPKNKLSTQDDISEINYRFINDYGATVAGKIIRQSGNEFMAAP